MIKEVQDKQMYSLEGANRVLSLSVLIGSPNDDTEYGHDKGTYLVYDQNISLYSSLERLN